MARRLTNAELARELEQARIEIQALRADNAFLRDLALPVGKPLEKQAANQNYYLAKTENLFRRAFITAEGSEPSEQNLAKWRSMQ